MLDATLYLVGKNARTGEYVENATSCAMCKRMVINAGIKEVIVREGHDKYKIIKVSDWIEHDDSLTENFGY